MTPKELIDKIIEDTTLTGIDLGHRGNTRGMESCDYILGELNKLRSLLSTHTREVAEKAFEAAREGNGGYRTDVEYIPFEPKYKSFEDYLNSLNPEGK